MYVSIFLSNLATTNTDIFVLPTRLVVQFRTVRFETEVLNDMRSSHADLLEAIANEKELSKENDDKLKSILDNFVEKFTSN